MANSRTESMERIETTPQMESSGVVDPAMQRAIQDRNLRRAEVKSRLSKDEPRWVLVEFRKPPLHRNVLLAFEEHWNQVVGFYCGKDKSGKVDRWYETSAETHNGEFKTQPKWWAEIPEVPHHP